MGSNDLFSNQAKPVIDRPLIAYAFLAQARQVSGDLLSGLTPIFKPIARDRIGQRFNPVEFSEVAKNLYGIEIHPWAVDDLAPRLEKAGLLSKNKVSISGEEYVYAEVAEEFDEVQEGDIRLVVQRFIEFARPILERHQIQSDDKALEDAFFAQLVSMDFHAILLKPDRSKDDLKESRAGRLSLPPKQEKVEWETTISAKSKIDVLCASFIVESFFNDKPLYDLIVRIATGALVAETVLNFQDPGSTANLNALRVILDAPFVMSLLDLTGEESTEYARSLCSQLVERGATIQIFRHSVDEIQSNLRGVVNAVEQGIGFGATSRRLGQAAFKEYLLSVLQNVEGAITRIGYKIVDVPTSTGSFQFFSDADEQGLKSALGYYENPIAKDRDAASIAAVMRLRQGRTSKMASFHQAQFIFVTDNSRVADRSNSFTLNRNLRDKHDVPPALTDRYIAGLLFVLFGGRASDLTHYRLLANCTAALEPRNDVIAKMHRFLSQLDETKAAHFRALMTDERASQHMMQLTLGDSVLISTTNDAEKILEQIESSLGEKYRRQHEQQLAEVTKIHDEEVERLVAEQQNLASQVRDTAAEVMSVRGEVGELKNHSAQLKDALQTAKLERLKEKCILLEDCVSRGLIAADKRHREISLVVAIATMVVAFAGTDYLTQFGKWISAAGAIFSGVIAYVGFGKNVERFFGRHLTAVRDAAFNEKVREYRLIADLEKFSINWESRKAELLDATLSTGE